MKVITTLYEDSYGSLVVSTNPKETIKVLEIALKFWQWIAIHPHKDKILSQVRATEDTPPYVVWNRYFGGQKIKLSKLEKRVTSVKQTFNTE